MATEPGVVTRIGPQGAGTVWVKTVPSSACEGCASRHQCNAASASGSREVEVLNEVGATVGDRIQLAISTRSLLRATFLLYIFPVIAMLIGGIAGQALAERFQWPTSLSAAIAAFACLGAAMLVVRAGGNRLARKAAYRPRIIRIIGRNPDFPGASDCQKPVVPTV